MRDHRNTSENRMTNPKAKQFWGIKGNGTKSLTEHVTEASKGKRAPVTNKTDIKQSDTTPVGDASTSRLPASGRV